MFTAMAYGEVVSVELMATQKGKEFHKIVIQDGVPTYNGDPNRLEFVLWPDDSNKTPRTLGDVKVGCMVAVQATLRSREYKGKFYTDVGATKLEVLHSTPVAPPVQIPDVTVPEFDDVPF